MQMKRRYRPRKRKAKQLAREVGERFGGDAGRLLEAGVEILELDDGREIILAGGKGILIRTPEGLLPTLMAVDVVPLRRVAVDMGAVPHVANGADIMVPGIVSAQADIKAGEVVVVVDERHGKPLAVGLALLPGPKMSGQKGKAVKNLHHVGDKAWQLLQERVK